MSSWKYVGPAIICRPETGENMSAQKKNFGGATPEPPQGGLRPPTPPPLTTTRAKNITHTQQIGVTCAMHYSKEDPKGYLD